MRAQPGHMGTKRLRQAGVGHRTRQFLSLERKNPTRGAEAEGWSVRISPKETETAFPLSVLVRWNTWEN